MSEGYLENNPANQKRKIKNTDVTAGREKTTNMWLVVYVYRRLNHHGSLISERSNDVQRKHRASGIQESERRLHRDQNACPSNPSAGGR